MLMLDLSKINKHLRVKCKISSIFYGYKWSYVQYNPHGQRIKEMGLISLITLLTISRGSFLLFQMLDTIKAQST